MNETNNLTLSFVLAGIVSISVFFFTSSWAALFFSLFIFIFGNIFSYTISNNRNNLSELKVFNWAFLFYVLLSINYFLGYDADWDSFIQDWRDEYKFFLIAETNQNLSIVENYKNSFIDRVYLEYGLYVFYISSIASISFGIFDGNHLLTQFLGTALFSILGSVIVYKILSLYVDYKKAYLYTLIFMFFSVFNFYGYNLIRDIAIAFFYICGIYFVLDSVKNRSIYKMILMILCNWLVLELRFEHGLLFSLLTAYMGVNVFRKNKVFLLIFSVVMLMLISLMFISKMDMLLLSLNSYTELTNDAVQSNENSLGKNLYILPPFIKQMAIIFISQIQPFPSWLNISFTNNIYQNFHGFLQIVYSFFWFVVFFSLIKWLILERKIFLLKKELKVLLVICLIFLLANTANMTLRRLIGFYPFIFLLYVYIKENFVTYKNFQKTIIFAFCFYFFLILMYLLIKI
ncbi:glycosyltransferase family 39 protein [Acinetobacter sp. YH12085]|uniref:glycosyltransferase family 39 protein n=1 Tax=Acinetobacter sp. YH12085 TaxID=2601077 RepID=UPI0015D2B9BB|nr:glycosyltransferase family 39 protein [Acinetobacter sp. YH12085]